MTLGESLMTELGCLPWGWGEVPALYDLHSISSNLGPPWTWADRWAPVGLWALGGIQ